MRQDAFFVDIESNFGTNPRFLSEHQIAEYCYRFSVALSPDPSDLVVVGCNPAITACVKEGWVGRAQIIPGPGKNGADKALITAASARYLKDVATVWICGADGDLLPIAQLANRLEKRVVLACGHRTPAKALQMAATRTAFLDIRPHPKGSLT